MMAAIEIQDHARKLMASFGPKAIAEAAQKAKAFEEQGQRDAAKDWRRIESALQQMQGPRVT